MELEPVVVAESTQTFPRLSSTSSCKDDLEEHRRTLQLEPSCARRSSTKLSPTLVLHDCAICLESSDESDKSFVKLRRCGHVFHQACVDEWLSTHNTCPMCRQLAAMWQQVQFIGSHSINWPASEAEKAALVRKLNNTTSSTNLKDRIYISKELEISFHRTATFFERLQGRMPKPTSFNFTQVKEFHHVKDGLLFVCNDSQRKGVDRTVIHMCRFRSINDARSTFDAVTEACFDMAKRMKQSALLY
eukprot:m.22395 g.22395  ORF g.22395 m.22395 type:complete len:246 (+) comp11245_c0_seq1:147-884(+)